MTVNWYFLNDMEITYLMIRGFTCMEVTFTVSKWDEKPIDDNKKISY